MEIDGFDTHALHGNRAENHSPGLLCLVFGCQTQDRASCQMASLYTRLGTISKIVYERLDALPISLMYWEDGTRLVSEGSMMTGLS